MSERTLQQAVPRRADAAGSDALAIRVPRQGEQVGRRAATPRGVCQPRSEADEPVVGEHLVEEGVVAAPIDIGPARLRDQGDDRHPAERHDPDHQRARRQVPHSPQERGHRGGDEVGQEERGDHEPGLHHLGLEGEADQCAGPQQRAQATGLAGADGGIGCQHEQQDEQRVRDVAAVEQDHDRAPGQHQRGDHAGSGAGHSPDGAVQDEDGEHPLDHLGQDERPDMEPEDPEGDGLDPERARDLVDRDRGPRVCRPVEEVVQAQRHAARRPAVEGLEVGLIEAPGVRQAGQRGDDQKRRARPTRLVGGGAPDAPGLVGAPTCAQARQGAGGERRWRRRDRVALFRLCDIGANGQRGLPARHCRRARPGRPGSTARLDDHLHA